MTITETSVMPRKKKPTAAAPPSESYRKPHKMVRIRLRLAELGEQAARDLEQDLTQYVNDALRERLAREGHWPPKAG
jgi:predicted HicB family RNase H-like nuclease